MEDQMPGTERPPHSVWLDNKRKIIVVKVTLHKIPHQYISCEPTDTEFVLDTIKYTKKFHLRIPYPHSATVSSKEADCELKYGILNVRIPVTSFKGQIGNKVKKIMLRRDRAAAKREAVLGNPTINLEKEEAKEEEKPEVEKKTKKKGKRAREEAEAEAEEENGDAAGDEEEEMPDESPKPKKKKKKALVNKTTELDLIDQINDAEDATRNKKITKAEAKEKWEEGREEKRQGKQSAREQKKNALLAADTAAKQATKAEAAPKKKKKSVTDSPNKKVSFAAEAPKAAPAKGKKKNSKRPNKQ